MVKWIGISEDMGDFRNEFKNEHQIYVFRYIYIYIYVYIWLWFNIKYFLAVCRKINSKVLYL